MNVKKPIVFLFVIISLVVAIESAFAVCSGFPDAFYGTLRINDEDAPIGTEIRAILLGEVRGSYTTAIAGQYGQEAGDDKLYVIGWIDGSGYFEIISFEVNVDGAWVDSGETSIYQCGVPKNLDIDVNIETPPECQTDSDCDDGLYCNGAEACIEGSCQAGTPLEVDDAVGCTIDSCDEDNDVIVNAIDDNLCDDGAYCNGAETCDAVNDCQTGIPIDCDDNVDCTDDSCNEEEDKCNNIPNDANCDDLVGCTDDICDAINDCQYTPNNINCDDGLYCNGQETCDIINNCQPGIAPDCNDNIGCTDDSCNEDTDSCNYIPNDNLCPSDTICADYYCSPTLDCQVSYKDATTICRASTGDCDVEEKCTGSSATCPVDDVKPNTEVCRASAGICDLADKCDGTTKACPSDAKSTTECRASVGICDVAENCDGVANDCPADQVQPSSYVCRSQNGDCDTAENCDGASKTCPTDVFKSSTTECRASQGVCDIAEKCTGSSASCPTDSVRPNTYECRASAGVCDNAEKCDGTNKACPTDIKSTAECRASAGVCDVAETCDGTSNECPANEFKSNEYICKVAAGECDLEEKCTGSSASCPVDTFKPVGTQCGEARDCRDDSCNGFTAEFYTHDGHDSCDASGTCLQYQCSLVDSYCSDNNATDGVNGLICGAPCDQNSDCTTTECDNLDKCYSGTYRDYQDRSNACTGSCNCEQNECTLYSEKITDIDGDGADVECEQDCDDNDADKYPGNIEICDGKDNDCDEGIDEGGVCTECTTDNDCELGYECKDRVCVEIPNVECIMDDDCNELDNNYCDADLIKQDKGICIEYQCDVETTTVEDCDDYDGAYCKGTEIWEDDGYCLNAECQVGTYRLQDCDDKVYCNGQERCENAQCIDGLDVDCSANNLPVIDTCTNDPDNNQFTLDYFVGFTSICDEGLDKCAMGAIHLSHICDIENCNAECINDEDCNVTICNGGCVGGKFHDCNNITNICVGCECTENSCPETAMCNLTGSDPDKDGVDNECGDNCPNITNPDQSDIDGDGIGDVCDEDDDNDRINDNEDCIIGFSQNITSNFLAEFRVGGELDPLNFVGEGTFEFTDGTNNIASFNFDCNLGKLHLNQIEIIKNNESDSEGYVIIRGVNLTDQNKTKTVYIDDLDNTTDTVCIKDKEVASISEISPNCDGTDEFSITCDNENGTTVAHDGRDYTCTKLDEGYNITGLIHSSVKEYRYVVASVSAEGGGGGGGGTTLVVTCIPNWQCTDWSNCQPNGKATKTCANLNNCEGERPSEERNCYYYVKREGIVEEPVIEPVAEEEIEERKAEESAQEGLPAITGAVVGPLIEKVGVINMISLIIIVAMIIGVVYYKRKRF